MNALKYFIFGFLAWYAIQIFDIIMNLINSYSAILVAKCQVKINELGVEGSIENPYAIGFRFEPQDDDEYEIDDDYID